MSFMVTWLRWVVALSVVGAAAGVDFIHSVKD